MFLDRALLSSSECDSALIAAPQQLSFCKMYYRSQFHEVMCPLCKSVLEAGCE